MFNTWIEAIATFNAQIEALKVQYEEAEAILTWESVKDLATTEEGQLKIAEATATRTKTAQLIAHLEWTVRGLQSACSTELEVSR